MGKPYFKPSPNKSALLVGHAPVMVTMSEGLVRDHIDGRDTASIKSFFLLKPGEILKKLLRTIASNVAGYHPDNKYTENRGILNPNRQTLNDQNYFPLPDEEKFNCQLVYWPIAKIITIKPSEHCLPEVTHPVQKVYKVV